MTHDRHGTGHGDATPTDTGAAHARPRRPSRRAVTAGALLGTGLALTAGGAARAGTARRTAPGPGLGLSEARAAAGSGAAAAGAGRALVLPPPTGPYPLGVTTLYLVDSDRNDPWEPAIGVREIMVTVLYPAHPAGDRPLATQMTEGAAAVFGVLDAPVHHLPPAGVDWAATRTHARLDAPALPGRRPVLLYSPGGGDPRALGTHVAEDLASHGYVVVLVDHPGDTSEVDFPVPRQGRQTVRTTVFRDDPRLHPAQFSTMIDTRLRDLRLVLDQLGELSGGQNPDATGRPLPRHLGRALDPERVGVYGHSAGGTAAAEALHEDRRLAAAVNLEGYLDHPATTPGGAGDLYPVARFGPPGPLLMLGTEGFTDRPGLERSWDALLSRPGGRTRAGRIAGAAHWVFTDYAAMVPPLQATDLMTAADRAALIGTLAGPRAVGTVRGALRAFFAAHLPARSRRPPQGPSGPHRRFDGVGHRRSDGAGSVNGPGAT